MINGPHAYVSRLRGEWEIEKSELLLQIKTLEAYIETAQQEIQILKHEIEKKEQKCST